MELVLKLLLFVVIAPLTFITTIALMVGGVLYETWAALTLLRWALPQWVIPVTLIQATVVNMAVSLCIRQAYSPRLYDDVSGPEMAKHLASKYILVPTMALGVGWVLLWFGS